MRIPMEYIESKCSLESKLSSICICSIIIPSRTRDIVKTGYLLINDDSTWEWGEFTLPQLLRKTVDNENDMQPTMFHHTIYEIEGDVADLANVKNSELLDKKVVRRSSEATLNLKNLTIEEELVEYMSAILNLTDDKVKQIMGVFNDYSKDAQLG